jgi:hypothetical protein
MGQVTGVVLRCQKCGELFSLAASLGEVEVVRLPDPLSAVCTHCGDQSSYPKSAICILVTEPEEPRR